MFVWFGVLMSLLEHVLELDVVFVLIFFSPSLPPLWKLDNNYCGEYYHYLGNLQILALQYNKSDIRNNSKKSFYSFKMVNESCGREIRERSQLKRLFCSFLAFFFLTFTCFNLFFFFFMNVKGRVDYTFSICDS